MLEVENLSVRFQSSDGPIQAVNGVSLSIEPGEIVGIVGESGSGKSVTAQSIIGVQDPGEITDGSIRFDGTELVDASARIRRAHRGQKIGMVFQDPSTALNPVFDIGEQIAEASRIHDVETPSLADFLHVPGLSNYDRWQRHRERAIALLEQVDIDAPKDRVDAYPHELSGGMRQRALIAIALAGDPELLIVDEPTTALDTTTQARVLERLHALATDTGTALLVISHDLGVVGELCDRVLVMYGGQVMERGPTDRLLESPAHPYTRGLLACRLDGQREPGELTTIPGTVPDRFDSEGCPFADRCRHATASCRTPQPTIHVGPGHEAVCGELEAIGSRTDARAANSHETREAPPKQTRSPAESAGDAALADTPVLEARDITKRYQLDDSILGRLFGSERSVTALDGVSLTLARGENIGIVGESGSGKSTLRSVLAGIEPPTSGEVRLDGEPVGTLEERTPEQLALVGVVFQAARESINPRLTVGEAIAEPLREYGWDRAQRRDRVETVLERTGLGELHPDRLPHQLSGGQLQRVAIARAIALEPEVLVLDEPVSALDVSITAQILNLLAELQRELGLSYLVISHDLAVVRHLADRVLVASDGTIRERGSATQIFEEPTDPTTVELLEAIPSVPEC